MDIVKTIPILFVVYLVISWIENNMDAVTRVVTSTEPAGPVIGALIGAIPQCGFSMGCSVLYCRGFLAPATLIAVYLSTSDEAIPVLFAGGCSWKEISELLGVANPQSTIIKARKYRERKQKKDHHWQKRHR